MSGSQDYYDLLGLDPSATPEEIKQRYRELSRTFHPDAGGTAAFFRLLNEAYEVLKDPERRAAYDKQRTSGQRSKAAREEPGRTESESGFVPDFLRLTLPLAERLAMENGIDLEFILVPVPKNSPYINHVVEQSPGAGGPLNRSTLVTLHVAIAPTAKDYAAAAATAAGEWMGEKLGELDAYLDRKERQRLDWESGAPAREKALLAEEARQADLQRKAAAARSKKERLVREGNDKSSRVCLVCNKRHKFYIYDGVLFGGRPAHEVTGIGCLRCGAENEVKSPQPPFGGTEQCVSCKAGLFNRSVTVSEAQHLLNSLQLATITRRSKELVSRRWREVVFTALLIAAIASVTAIAVLSNSTTTTDAGAEDVVRVKIGDIGQPTTTVAPVESNTTTTAPVVSITTTTTVAVPLDLSRANLRNENLSYRDLTGANLTSSDLSFADLTWADLSRADLSRADLTLAKLSGADLGGADLTYANLTEADLSMANLGGANLSGADLGGADLTGANLAGADLTDANLTFADLTDAYLGGADLTGAYLSGTTGPDGRRPFSP